MSAQPGRPPDPRLPGLLELAVLIKAEPALAAAWHSLIDGPARDDGHGDGG